MEKQEKTTIIKEYARTATDVGSADVQVALLTHRVAEIAGHLKLHPKDHGSRRGLIAMVNRRRRLLSYLSRTAHTRYLALIKRLELRH